MPRRSLVNSSTRQTRRSKPTQRLKYQRHLMGYAKRRVPQRVVNHDSPAGDALTPSGFATSCGDPIGPGGFPRANGLRTQFATRCPPTGPQTVVKLPNDALFDSAKAISGQYWPGSAAKWPWRLRKIRLFIMLRGRRAHVGPNWAETAPKPSRDGEHVDSIKAPRSFWEGPFWADVV